MREMRLNDATRRARHFVSFCVVRPAGAATRARASAAALQAMAALGEAALDRSSRSAADAE